MTFECIASVVFFYGRNVLCPHIEGIKWQLIPGNCRKVIKSFAIAIESQWIAID